MEPINLNPAYSTSKIPGKCIKCLAEKELDNCLIRLLGSEDEDDDDDDEVRQRFETLVTFLRSPQSRKLRDESEKYLADGKQVTVKINFETGKPEYELKVD